MIFNKFINANVYRLIVLLVVTGCGGGSGSGSSSSGNTVSGNNVLPIIVDAGPAGLNEINIPYTSVTICTPGTNTCQTIDHIIVDTASTGLRIMAQVLSPAIVLTQQGTANLNECLPFADGYTWGSVKLADVKLAGEPTLKGLAIQVIGDPAAPSVPSACANTGTPENTVAAFGGNGILGVGTFQQDCGSVCAATAANVYYTCSGTASCTAIAIPLNSQLQNPVGLLPGDNNGVVITLPPVAATGSAPVSGSLILGIGTQANNAPGIATLHQLNPGKGTLTTLFNGQSYKSSFFDSASNALYFSDSSLAQCTSNSFYCPVSLTYLTATIQGSNSTSSLINFTVVNAEMLFSNASYTASSGLAGPGGLVGKSLTFDWGLPFYFGRTVFTSIEGANGAGSPYVAF
jgi:hypothetical protein